LECGARKGWRRSVGPIVRKVKKIYMELRKRGMSYKQYKGGTVAGLVTSWVETAFTNRLLKEREREE
jgi:hypothetical protein